MKGIVGAPARKAQFFQRDREIARIIDRINDGNNIQIAAPRRVGKTSILFSLLDKGIEKHLYAYVDTEAVYNEQDFFKKVLKEIIQIDELKKSTKLKMLWESGGKFLSKIKSINIAGAGLDFQENSEDVNYKEDLENLLCGIELQNNQKLVLLIDEFPQTIQNIVTDNNGILKPAIQFLQSNRDIRLNPEINGKVIFIYTGSIGLNHTVSIINGSAFINDLNSLEVGPLQGEEPKELLKALLSEKNKTISNEVANYLLDKIEWHIPFHIQLAVQEIVTLTYDNSEITKELIDDAFKSIIATRNNNHFDHYFSRLKSLFKNSEFDYADELLKMIAENNTIDKGVAIDLSVKYGVQNNWKTIMEILKYDGYINNNVDHNTYRFNSPILRMWWQHFICN